MCLSRLQEQSDHGSVQFFEFRVTHKETLTWLQGMLPGHGQHKVLGYIAIFMTIFLKRDKFGDVLLLLCTVHPFPKGSTLKRKHLLLFPVRIERH